MRNFLFLMILMVSSCCNGTINNPVQKIAERSDLEWVKIHVFKDNNGLELGKVYIKPIIKDSLIFRELIIVKDSINELNPLYEINNTRSRNRIGDDNFLVNTQNFSGYKIVSRKNISITLDLFWDNNFKYSSADPIIIRWNSKSKVFEWLRTP